MGKLSPNARAADDRKVIRTQLEARRLCSSSAYGWRETVAAVKARDRDLPCARCGSPVDYALKSPDPASASIDHMGTGPADVIGWRKGDARRALHNRESLRVSHLRCNMSAGRGDASTVTAPPAAAVAPVVDTSRRSLPVGDICLGLPPYDRMPEDERQALLITAIAQANAYREAIAA